MSTVETSLESVGINKLALCAFLLSAGGAMDTVGTARFGAKKFMVESRSAIRLVNLVLSW